MRYASERYDLDLQGVFDMLGEVQSVPLNLRGTSAEERRIAKMKKDVEKLMTNDNIWKAPFDYIQLTKIYKEAIDIFVTERKSEVWNIGSKFEVAKRTVAVQRVL